MTRPNNISDVIIQYTTDIDIIFKRKHAIVKFNVIEGVYRLRKQTQRSHRKKYVEFS